MSRYDDITAFIHCLACAKEALAVGKQSPRDYARLSIGFDGNGAIVVWCVRHDKLVFDSEAHT